jgi:hypothetical protein
MAIYIYVLALHMAISPTNFRVNPEPQGEAHAESILIPHDYSHPGKRRDGVVGTRRSHPFLDVALMQFG